MNANKNCVGTKLRKLDKYIQKIPDFYIGTFNLYVKSIIEILTKRGETTHDLTINLFKG